MFTPVGELNPNGGDSNQPERSCARSRLASDTPGASIKDSNQSLKIKRFQLVRPRVALGKIARLRFDRQQRFR